MGYLPLFFLGKEFPAARVTKQNRAPTTADSRYEVGTIWADVDAGITYICEKNASRVATWKALGDSGISFQQKVISKVVAQAAAVATEGNRYIAPAAGATWTQWNLYEYKSGAWEETAAVEGMICYVDDVDETDIFDGATWNNLVSPVTTLAGLTDTAIVGVADKNILVYVGGTTKWTNLAMTGDIVISAAGATSFNGSPIVNADVNAAAAIDFSKLAALASANVLIGSAGGVATVTAITGDVTLTNAGLTAVTDLTVAGEAQGNVLYFNGTNWTALAPVNDRFLRSNGAAANPSWEIPSAAIASSLANGATLNDAGANDAILAFTQQTVAAPTLTVPDFASVNDTFVFVTLAQTLLNKTLTAPTINGGQANSLTALSIRSSGAAFDLTHATAEVLTAGKTISWNVGDTARSITLGGNIALGGGLTTLGAWSQVGAFTVELTTTGATAVTLPTTGTLVTLAGAEELTTKTITAGILKTSAVLQQTTANYTFTWADPAAARAISIDDPLGNDKFAFLAAAQALSSKTINCASNTVTNVSAEELEQAPAAMGTGLSVPFIVKADVKNSLETALYTAAFPVKARLVKAWAVSTVAGNSGTGSITDGTNIICATENYNGTDTKIVDFTTIDDAYDVLAPGATLKVVNSNNTDDANIFIMFMPIA